MPPLVFPQESTAQAAAILANKASPANLTLRLYSNSHLPAVTDTLASFTEVVGAGYAAIPLIPGQWTVTPGSPSVALYSAFQNFTFSGPTALGTVYGYYVTTAGGLVLLAEQLRASGAPWVPFAGGTLQVRPRFGADNLVRPPVDVPEV